MKRKALKFFISYSHRDIKFKEKLLVSLNSLSSQYDIDVWHDGKILAGGNIDKSVLSNLVDSDVILLLVTPNFLNSWYCMEVELNTSIKRMEKGECIVVPVICQECTLVETLPFYALKRVPNDGKAISKFNPHSRGCVEATNLIKNMIDVLFHDRAKSVSNHSGIKSKDSSAGFLSVPLIKNGELKDIPINQSFVKIIPDCINGLIDFNTMMEQSLNISLKRFKKDFKLITNEKNRHAFELKELRIFLMDICGYIKKYITDSVGIRVHFRGTRGKHYVGIIASSEKEDSLDMATDWSTDLTPIPVTQGLIYYSNELKAPLLKSLNSKLNFKGNNDNIWKDYLTYSFRNLNKGKNPVISMAISVQKNYLLNRKELFMFLAYIDFGEIVERYIKRYCDGCLRIDKDYDLEKLISRMR